MRLPKGNNIFLSNSFFIFITRFFPHLATLLVLIWYSRQLPAKEYGEYQLFWIQLYVLYPFMSFGIQSFVITYAKGALANMLSLLKKKHYILYVAWLVIFASAFGLLQSKTGSVPFATSALFILSYVVGIVCESVLIVFRKFATLAITGFFYAAFFCLIHLFALGDHFSIPFIFSSLVVINMLRLFTYSMVMLAEIKKDGEGYAHEDLPINTIRTLWLHLGMYDVLQVLSSWIDKFIISLLLTAELSAIYYNGARDIPVLPLLLTAAGSAVLLQLSGGARSRETEDTIDLVNQSGRILSCIVYPIFCFLFLFRNELVVTLLSDKYIPSIPIFAVSLLVLPLRAYSFTTVLQRRHKGHIINAGALGELLLAVGLMYPLYLWLGLAGVALSFVISTYLQAAFYLLFTAREMNVSPFTLVPLGNWLIKLSLFMALFYVIHYTGGQYFSGRFTLTLGAMATVAAVAVSLLVEIIRNKKHGRLAAQV